MLTGWGVADLVAHLGLVADSIVAAGSLMSPTTPMSVSDYLGSYTSVADEIDSRTRARGHSGHAGILTELDELGSNAAKALERIAGDDPVVMARRGPVRWSDFLVTRCIELAVHGDDLDRSVPDLEGPTLEASCLKLVTRELAEVLAGRAPGRSVELRIPPFAAVQCVEGPRHSRGTPGAVVEITPRTFLRLAAGRLGWADGMAQGVISASGERADLGTWLPLLG